MAYTFNGKEINFSATSVFNDKYGGLEAGMYIRIALSVLKKYPVDMLVFEMTTDGCQQVRLSGYDFNTQVLDEKTVAYKAKSLPTDKFWLKIDDFEIHYIGTFLFPDEY
jgi:hypothetical protein